MSYEDVMARGSEQQQKEMKEEEEGWRKGVAAAVFQINTSVASFRRLVQSLGTSKDSPQLREKM